jgi:S-ribosylhomocysteine lyase
MEKIASFQIDHLRLKPGIYVSRKDTFGGAVITTFDLRFKEPNKEPVMDMPALHSFEHLGATFLRAHPQWGKDIIYFGPMGCRTGCYLLMNGDLDSAGILPLIREMCGWIIAYDGEEPGVAPGECGNWREHNQDMCKYEAALYAKVLANAGPENLTYPA